MWAWHGDMIGPAIFVGECAGTRRGLCLGSWASIGEPFVHCSPTWWWGHNIVHCPNRTSICRTVTWCWVGAVHFLSPRILPQSCQQLGWRRLVVCCVSTSYVLFCFDVIHVVILISQAVAGQWFQPVNGRTFPFGSCSRPIHPVLQGLWDGSAWWHHWACWQFVVACICIRPWGCWGRNPLSIVIYFELEVLMVLLMRSLTVSRSAVGVPASPR